MSAATVSPRREALGIALILLMAACFTAADTLIKYLGGSLPVLLILWVRYAVQALAMALWLAVTRPAGFRPREPRFQLLRGSLLLATSALLFFGLQHMPLAEFTALGMLTPVFSTLLAAWLLRESVSPLRWALVGGGFAGVLIMVRPGTGIFGWAAAVPVLMAICYAGFQVLTRKLATLEDPYTTHFCTGFIGTLLLTPMLVLLGGAEVARTVAAAPAWQLLLLLAVGVLGTTSHLLLIFAFRLARTATLMPFTYAQIAFAGIAGWLLFRHVPDLWAWVGIAVIGACGAASAWLQVQTRPPLDAVGRPRAAVAAD